MKVKELMALLKDVDPEREVILAADEEGNHFNTVYSVEIMCYKEDEVSYEQLTEELKAQGFTEDDIDSDGKPCVVIWP